VSQLRPIRAFALCVPLFLGCSSAEFGVTNAGLDAGGDDASLDTAVLVDAADSTAADAPSSDATDPPETLVPDAAGDTADGAVADALGDSADASPADTCASNACGGCTPLSKTPGDKCGACGTFACAADKDSVLCNDPGKNACGGCKSLSQSPGASCGACGIVACSADGESVGCNDPGKNACNGCKPLAAKPGDACGIGCGGGTYQCSGTEALECKDATMANACGGCSALPHALGTACGVCGGGTYVCSPSDKNAVVCSDPVTTPAPGTACGGKCNTRKYACDPGGKSTSCGADPVTTPAPATACGGKCGSATYQCDATNTATTCVDPAASSTPPGTACGGVCGSATYVCSNDKSFTQCVDPVPTGAPTPASACGVCGSSTNQCNAAKTGVACVKPDDRTPLNGPDQQLNPTVSAGYLADRVAAFELPFTVAKGSTRILTVNLQLAREAYGCELQGDCDTFDPECTCSCTSYSCAPKPTLTPNGLALELWTGTPAAPGTLLETSTETPSSIPLASAASPSSTTFSFNVDHRLAASTAVFVRLRVTGPGFQYRIYGDSKVTATSVRLYYHWLGTAPQQTAFEPWIFVQNFDCP
jgi:hypothetical protein